MQIHSDRLLAGAQRARGTAVIIDVFRAFTCTPLMFSLGIQKSILVASAQEAFALKSRDEALLLSGEVKGLPIDGFDLANSPSEILRRGASYFKRKTVVQRTSSGVQGALAALDVADEVLLASYNIAGATARYILATQPQNVSLVAMGWDLKEIAPEDECCARYISHLLGFNEYNHNEALSEILFNETAQRFLRADEPDFPAEDPSVCLQRNVYDFALQAKRKENQVVVHKIATP
ncbi:MAG: 2-phosphosulfolactate phosphatase [Desulfobacterales bacterium]|jgi:2-phosphosulfolactate phosphatase